MPISKYTATTDGIDHINIYSKGKTTLGRMLSNFACTPFTHPEDGKFASIEDIRRQLRIQHSINKFYATT